jgi:hypothetical protein
MICALPLSGYCADVAGTAKSPACPGAAAWQEAHPEELPAAVDARDAARHFTLPELRRELQTRFELDQKTRRTYLSAVRSSTGFPDTSIPRAASISRPSMHVV